MHSLNQPISVSLSPPRALSGRLDQGTSVEGERARLLQRHRDHLRGGGRQTRVPDVLMYHELADVKQKWYRDASRCWQLWPGATLAGMPGLSTTEEPTLCCTAVIMTSKQCCAGMHGGASPDGR